MKFFTAFVAGASATVHSIDDCPTKKCWEIINNKCSLKASCNTLLTCTPDNVDFRYNHADLFGAENTYDQIPQARDDCPPTAFNGLDGRDRQWLAPLGSCNSGCEKTADNKLKVTKKFKYAGAPYTGDNLGDVVLFTDVKTTIEVEIACLFDTTFRATSDQIELRDEEFEHEGKLEVEGSWKESLSIKYMLPFYSGETPSGHVQKLGTKFRVQVNWSVYNKPIATKLNWYLSKCKIEGLDSAGNVENSVNVVENICYAGVLNTKPDFSMTSAVVTEKYRFEYDSFSFNTDGGGKHRICCDVEFCLKDDCASQTAAAAINCPLGEAAYGWEKVTDLL